MVEDVGSLLGHPAQHRFRHLPVDRVAELVHVAPALRLLPDRADEHHGPASARMGDEVHDLVDRHRLGADAGGDPRGVGITRSAGDRRQQRHLVVGGEDAVRSGGLEVDGHGHAIEDRSGLGVLAGHPLEHRAGGRVLGQLEVLLVDTRRGGQGSEHQQADLHLGLIIGP